MIARTYVKVAMAYRRIPSGGRSDPGSDGNSAVGPKKTGPWPSRTGHEVRQNAGLGKRSGIRDRWNGRDRIGDSEYYSVPVLYNSRSLAGRLSQSTGRIVALGYHAVAGDLEQDGIDGTGPIARCLADPQGRTKPTEFADELNSPASPIEAEQFIQRNPRDFADRSRSLALGITDAVFPPNDSLTRDTQTLSQFALAKRFAFSICLERMSAFHDENYGNRICHYLSIVSNRFSFS